MCALFASEYAVAHEAYSFLIEQIWNIPPSDFTLKVRRIFVLEDLLHLRSF